MNACFAYFTLSQSTRRSHRAASSALCGKMRVGVVGCAHGELDALYSAVKEAESVTGPLDLVLCPGDFEAIRNATDLSCMACPNRFRKMNSFWKYYSGASVAPVPTLFVGGNHEASNHLQELRYGGLVAPNMYYLGDSGVVSVGGLRIAGISGVYTQHNYNKPRFERPPYERSQLRSVYHAREDDVKRLKRLQRARIDVMMSHDWPQDIVFAGDTAELLRQKPFLRAEIDRGEFGNPGTKDLLATLKPSFWFAAHMHVKFAARVEHPGGKVTKFLALDKILPKRDFLQVIEIPVEKDSARSVFPLENEMVLGDGDCAIEMDPEWVAILRSEVKEGNILDRPVTDEEIQEVIARTKDQQFRPMYLSCTDFKHSSPVHSANASDRAERPTSLTYPLRTLAIAKLVGVDLANDNAEAARRSSFGTETPTQESVQTTMLIEKPASIGTVEVKTVSKESDECIESLAKKLKTST